MYQDYLSYLIEYKTLLTLVLPIVSVMIAFYYRHYILKRLSSISHMFDDLDYTCNTAFYNGFSDSFIKKNINLSEKDFPDSGYWFLIEMKNEKKEIHEVEVCFDYEGDFNLSKALYMKKSNPHTSKINKITKQGEFIETQVKTTVEKDDKIYLLFGFSPLVRNRGFLSIQNLKIICTDSYGMNNIEEFDEKTFNEIPIYSNT